MTETDHLQNDEIYSVPGMNDWITSLGKEAMISTLDISTQYWQLGFSSPQSDKSAFTSCCGQ